MAFRKNQLRKFSLSNPTAIAAALIIIIWLATDEHVKLERGIFSYPAPSSKALINSGQDDTQGATRPCLHYIFYDKPVKTGSAAIYAAIRKYVDTISEHVKHCMNWAHCTQLGVDVCTGKEPKAHMIHHILLNSSMTACLRNNDYYHVTSIRNPTERIISAWRYSHSQKQSYYGIPFNLTLLEFLDRFPKCALYNYYDGLESRCTKENALKRAEEIASRFDEVIDLSDSVIGDLHQRIQGFLKEVNVSPRRGSTTEDLILPDDVAELEYVLYNKLREKRISLTRRKERVLCQR